MSRLLVVEDSPTQAAQIRLLLEGAGYQVEVAEDGVAAMEAIKRQQPELVVTDMEMPRMNGLELVENIRQSFAAIPVILVTAFGSEDVAALALSKGAASYVPKRYVFDDLLPTVGNILSLSGAERDQQRIWHSLDEVSLGFLLENDTELIPPLITYLECYLQKLEICDRTGLIQVNVAWREALVNAIEHGNLEASSSLCEKDPKAYNSLIRDRRNQAPYKDRRVRVMARMGRDQATLIVTDQGPGFDPSVLPDPTDPRNLENIRGRGILLIRTFMDEVFFNKFGNEITMIKRR